MTLRIDPRLPGNNTGNELSAHDEQLLIRLTDLFRDHARAINNASLMLSAAPSVCGGRLGLASGIPFSNPVNVIAVSGQDTSAETITVTAHGWIAGTMVVSSATSGGLTAGTQYYVGNPTANTITLHTTVATALAGTSPVNITGAVTASITPCGLASTSVWWVPWGGSTIALYNGSAWDVLAFTNTQLAIGTKSANTNYDVFGYNNAGTFALEWSAAWAANDARTDALALQNGVYCKASDLTRRYLGTIRTTSTTTTEDSRGGVISQVGGKRFVWNLYNRYNRTMQVIDSTASWTWATQSYHQANAAAGNKVEFVAGLQIDEFSAQVLASVLIAGGVNSAPKAGIGFNSTTVAVGLRTQVFNTVGIATSTVIFNLQSTVSQGYAIGYNAINWLERGSNAANQTFYGVDDNTGAQSGLTCSVPG